MQGFRVVQQVGLLPTRKPNGCGLPRVQRSLATLQLVSVAVLVLDLARRVPFLSPSDKLCLVPPLCSLEEMTAHLAVPV